MKTPLYRQAIFHSWKLAWEHKILWIFGAFTIFLGQMGILDLLSKVSLSVASSPMHVTMSQWLWLIKDFLAEMKTYSAPFDIWVWSLALALIFLGFLLFLIFISVVSQGALIKAAAVSVKHKKLPNAGEEWHVGVKHFWRLFFVNLVKKIIFCILSVFVSWLALISIAGFSVFSAIIFLFFFTVAALIGMIVSFLTIYAAGYVVVEEFSFKESWVSAWRLFVKHWLVSMEVGLIILLLNLVIGIFVVAGVIILIAPSLAILMLTAASYNVVVWLVALLFGIILPIALIMLAGSLLSVFNISVWTCLFMAMHKVGIKSRILHLFGHYSK